MSEQLKRCSICKSPAEKMWDLQEKLVRCTNRTCHNSLYSVYLNEWQKRPIEDELQARIAELEAEIRNWQDCYCEFETIAPDGKLKISVLDIYNRIAELNARIAELEAEVTKCHELQDSYCDRIAQLEKEIARRDEELLELNNKAVFIKFENEDELPAEIKDDVYSAMFECSHVDGVRLFPYIEENGQKYFLVMLKEDV